MYAYGTVGKSGSCKSTIPQSRRKRRAHEEQKPQKILGIDSDDRDAVGCPVMTWDPFRVFLDENFDLDASLETKMDSYDYSYTVDNTSLKVMLPVAEAQK